MSSSITLLNCAPLGVVSKKCDSRVRPRTTATPSEQDTLIFEHQFSSGRQVENMAKGKGGGGKADDKKAAAGAGGAPAAGAGAGGGGAAKGGDKKGGGEKSGKKGGKK
ncbi:Hypothetical predicted protein [Cloeon dipterum]|uniref:Uncharacterized protein n=1 Tax=Cloeon dipterum TaxID=197152 RepID=A0A8S1BZZ9_9INSE|nr:Hypothetical predicted protein [Cloeon dipterum]